MIRMLKSVPAHVVKEMLQTIVFISVPITAPWLLMLYRASDTISVYTGIVFVALLGLFLNFLLKRVLGYILLSHAYIGMEATLVALCSRDPAFEDYLRSYAKGLNPKGMGNVFDSQLSDEKNVDGGDSSQ